MSTALLLWAALLAATAGLGWLALAMDVHWQQVSGLPHVPPRTQGLLRVLGVAALSASLALCLAADHPTMAALVWVMLLAAGALGVAFTLSWRPRWLALLVPWTLRAASRRTQA
jgi:Protein of unknown function (DUF3325)